MTPPISDDIKKQLENLYYTNKNFVGRDRLYKLAVSNNIDVSRRQVMDWLAKQELHQLYWPVTESKEMQSTVLNNPHDQIGIDLIDMQNYEHSGYKYILTAIDLFSKKAYAVALKNKSQSQVNAGIKKIISLSNPKSIRSDNGSEFIADSFKSILKDNNISQVLSLPGKPQSNGNIERFNGTLKRAINKDLMYEQSYDWHTSLSTLINNYNNTYQYTIKDTPDNVDKLIDYIDKVEIKNRIYEKVTDKNGSTRVGSPSGPKAPFRVGSLARSDMSGNKIKFNVGDTVRIKLPNDKTRQNWSDELYTIRKVGKPRQIYSVPFYYVSNINNDDIIKHKYYDNDLLLIPAVENEMKKEIKYVISKILDHKKQKNKYMYLIKWKGYKNTTWEPYDMLIEDVPKMINAYDRKLTIVHH